MNSSANSISWIRPGLFNEGPSTNREHNSVFSRKYLASTANASIYPITSITGDAKIDVIDIAGLSKKLLYQKSVNRRSGNQDLTSQSSRLRGRCRCGFTVAAQVNGQDRSIAHTEKA
jgi:hypothetical protein